MTESKEFIQSKLSNRTNADASNTEAKNNRWHYHLYFEQSIGWDWLYGQVRKSQSELDTDLEIWEIHPASGSNFAVEVREVERREGIDNSQQGLSDFE